MNVKNGDCVRVTLIKNSPNQTHGLAISYYENNGIVVRPNRTGGVEFLATMTGRFGLFAQTDSTISSFTNNAGTLIVT
jgi:hypothetical protein